MVALLFGFSMVSYFDRTIMSIAGPEIMKEFGVAPKYRVLSRPMLRVAEWFNPLVRESYEMLYQSDSPYLFDSTKFAKEFGFTGTPYPEGIRIAADSYKRKP